MGPSSRYSAGILKSTGSGSPKVTFTVSVFVTAPSAKTCTEARIHTVERWCTNVRDGYAVRRCPANAHHWYVKGLATSRDAEMMLLRDSRNDLTQALAGPQSCIRIIHRLYSPDGVVVCGLAFRDIADMSLETLLLKEDDALVVAGCTAMFGEACGVSCRTVRPESLHSMDRGIRLLAGHGRSLNNRHSTHRTECTTLCVQA